MMVNEIYGFMAPQGWQCPVCNRVYAPSVPCCYYCGAEGRTKTTTSTGYIDWQKQQSITISKEGQSITIPKERGEEE